MSKHLVTAARHSASVLLAATAALPLQAALAANPDIVVTKFTDSLDGSCNSDCSLREAVQLANQTPGVSRIILAAGTYTLSIPRLPNPADPDDDPDDFNPLLDDNDNLNGDLDIKGRLTIIGRGIDITVIDGGRIDRIAQVFSDAVVTFSNLTVYRGVNRFMGGGLLVNEGGTLSLQSCAVSFNFVFGSDFGPNFGGGIANFGTLSVNASRIDGNTASGIGNAGALKINASRIERNSATRGGGVFNTGNLSVRDTRFIENTSANDDDSGRGGAIFNTGIADIRRASFERNFIPTGFGSAILNTGIGQLRLENSTVSGNANDAANPFFNQAALSPAAVQNGEFNTISSSARMINVTIAGNEGYGLINHGRLGISNSIVTGNGLTPNNRFGVAPRDQNCLNVGTGARFSQVGLLRGTDTGNCATTLLVLNADSFATVLYPLAMNNGQSPTFALRRGSIAVDAAIGACPFTDQRRVIRLRDGNGDGIIACDLGSYERTKP